MRFWLNPPAPLWPLFLFRAAARTLSTGAGCFHFLLSLAAAGPLVCAHTSEFKVISAVLCSHFLSSIHAQLFFHEVSPFHPHDDGKVIRSKLEYTTQTTFLISFLQYCTYAYMHSSTVRQKNEIAGRENSPNVTRCYFWAWLELFKLSTRHILFLMRKIKWFLKNRGCTSLESLWTWVSTPPFSPSVGGPTLKKGLFSLWIPHFLHPCFQFPDLFGCEI